MCRFNREESLRSLSRSLRVSAPAITKRIKSAPIQFIKGRSSNGSVNTFYSEHEVRKLCLDLLTDLPQANEDGFLEIDGKVYGTATSLAGSFGISPTTIQKRVKNKPVPSIEGRNSMGSVNAFYPESEVRELCADLIAKKTKK